MSNSLYPVVVAPEPKTGVPEINASFGRVTVILGANGSGKSKVLQRIRGFPSPAPSPKVYVEGGRTIRIPPNLKPNSRNFHLYQTPEIAASTHKEKQANTLADRVTDALLAITKAEDSIKRKHSDAVTAWSTPKERKGECPRRDEPPMERLFRVFKEVFPSIDIELEQRDLTLWCTKGGSARYSVSGLSDGEKQVFSLLADLVILGSANGQVIVDEPELNLNPSLACRVWDTIENELPDASFVYATHCLSFAMRPNVDRLIGLRANGGPAVELGTIADLEPDEARHFLGSVPGILSSATALAVEGTDSSFDSLFYPWILGRTDVTIVPVGGCEEVGAAARGTGAWEKIAHGATVVGAIDRDFRDDERLEQFVGAGVIALRFHEAESYLCQPSLLSAIAQAVGIAERVPTVEEITDAAIEEFKRQKLRVAATRTSERCRIRLAVSVSRRVFQNVASEESAIQKLSELAEAELAKASKVVGKDAVAAVFGQELARCDKAINERLIDEILVLCPGKELLNKLAAKAGFKDGMALLRGARTQFLKADLPSLKGIRDELSSIFDKATAAPKAA